MIFYKKIDLDYFDEIVRDSLEFIKNDENIFYRKTGYTYHVLDIEKFLNAVPKLNLAFAKFDLVCNFAVAFVMYKNSHSPIHIDKFIHNARINIPLLNCKNSVTKFFDKNVCKFFERPDNQRTGNVLIGSYYNEKIHKAVDEVVIDKTTIILVNEPHTVIMDEFQSPRITLTLGFNKDPVFLL